MMLLLYRIGIVMSRVRARDVVGTSSSEVGVVEVVTVEMEKKK